MNIIFEIIDWREFDPLNIFYTPNGFKQEPIYFEIFYFQFNTIIKPFLQNYEYLVIDYDQLYGTVKIIPHCNFAKKVFLEQYKKK